MKHLVLIGLWLLVFGFSQSEEALEISAQFERDKIAALETYLEENPGASDRDIALSILVGSFFELGDYEPVPDLLIERYELMPVSEEVNFQLLIAKIARPMVEASISTDQRDKAKAFITRVRSDYADSPASAQVNQILDQIGASLYLPGVGDEMTFAFTSLDGEEIDLASMRDKVILVDFWATWCGPCIAVLPHLMEIYENYRSEGFEVIGVSHDENREELEAFLGENEVTWPQYFDGQGKHNELAQRFGISKIPTTFLVGKGGKIVAADLDGDELTEAIEKELEKDP
ncbi:MAG: TlpA disulfide reductase family protein [Verrucomicrobiota bacterium]